MSLKAIEEKLKERIEIENAIKEIQSQISEEETIEKIIQVLETKDKIIDFMLDDLNLNGYKKEEIIDMLNIDGRLCVITFHSLEDKICKDIFKKNSEINKVFRGLPNIPYEYLPKLEIIKKITPSATELDNNNRSRSAKLRIIEKI